MWQPAVSPGCKGRVSGVCPHDKGVYVVVIVAAEVLENEMYVSTLMEIISTNGLSFKSIRAMLRNQSKLIKCIQNRFCESSYQKCDLNSTVYYQLQGTGYQECGGYHKIYNDFYGSRHRKC